MTQKKKKKVEAVYYGEIKPKFKELCQDWPTSFISFRIAVLELEDEALQQELLYNSYEPEFLSKLIEHEGESWWLLALAKTWGPLGMFERHAKLESDQKGSTPAFLPDRRSLEEILYITILEAYSAARKTARDFAKQVRRKQALDDEIRRFQKAKKQLPDTSAGRKIKQSIDKEISRLEEERSRLPEEMKNLQGYKGEESHARALFIRLLYKWTRSGTTSEKKGNSSTPIETEWDLDLGYDMIANITGTFFNRPSKETVRALIKDMRGLDDLKEIEKITTTYFLQTVQDDD